MHSLIHSLANALFPTRCAGCGTFGSGLCERCTAVIPAAPMLGRATSFAAYDYGNRLVEKAIRDLKYYRKGEAALALAGHAAGHIAEFVASIVQSEGQETLVLVPVPQHARKTRHRGFNQSVSLARAVARSLDGAHVSSLLKKTRFTLPQVHIKNKSARLTNLTRSMEAIKRLDPHTLYIIVDDVTTTSATFTEAERALRAAGAKKVLSIALAHGHPKRK